MINSSSTWAGLLLLLLASGAAAQDTEQVTVEKNRGLVGLWRVSVPNSIAIHLFGRAEFGAMRQIFCRIEDNLDIHCLNGGFSRNGAVTIDGDDVHIAWGTAMARFVIDGRRDGDAITGTFTIKVSGIAHDAPTASLSARYKPGDASPQDGDLELANRLQSPQGRAALPHSMDTLGALEHVEYLGHSPNLNGSGGTDFFSVYALEFTSGERICGTRAGAPEQFECI
jgi:hypothetical protein